MSRDWAFRLLIATDQGLAGRAQGGAAHPDCLVLFLGVLAFNVYAGPLGYVVALGLLGWGDAFHHVRRQARAEGAKAFIESARAQGMTRDPRHAPVPGPGHRVFLTRL